MKRLLAAVIAGVVTLSALASVPVVSIQVVPTAEGDIDSRFIDGIAPPPNPNPLEFLGLIPGLNSAGIEDIVVPIDFIHDVRQYLTGTEQATAPISIIPVSGDDPETSGWAEPASGNNLVYDAVSAGAGTFQLFADGSSSDDTSLTITWLATADAPPPGSGYDFPAGTTPTVSSNALTARTTFHNVGLYWKQTANNTTNQALVRYCKVSTGVCKQGLSLWWDDRAQGTAAQQVPYGFKEGRGSVVGLESNTVYSVEVLTESSRVIASTQFTTWNETFPIGTTVTPSASSSSTLSIGTSGTASAYRLYDRSGGWAIDGNFSIDNAVEINASYVIVRGLTCTQVDEFCVTISASSHHVVIEDSDFSDMGVVGSDGFACNGSGGISTPAVDNFSVTNIVIQNNRFHDPTFDSNSWEEGRQGGLNRPDNGQACSAGSNDSHPAGAVPLELNNTGGSNVIRYNEIDSDFTHMWKDGFSGQQNFSHNGDVRRDTDIYRNIVSFSWDDGIQTEGANMNVRIYENLTESVLTSQAHAAVSIGPLYAFRNVAMDGVRTPGASTCEGWFIKTRTKPNVVPVNSVTIGQGALYAINNTVYRTSGTSSSDCVNQTMQMDEGASRALFFWNNVLNTRSAISSTNLVYMQNNSDFENNLYSSAHAKPSNDSSGNSANPSYDAGHASGPYTPAAGSQQLDSGTVIPNFTDGYSGALPDRGAVERGQTEVIYGNQ